MIDPTLAEYAQTERQSEIIQAVIESSTYAEAAAKLDIHKRGVERAVSDVKHRATMHGYSPEHGWVNKQPNGFPLSGVSTLMKDANGNLQWVKAQADKEQREEQVKQAIEAMYADLPKIKAPKAPRKYDKDIIPWYQIGDGHLGMLAHEWETGHNFDLKIAQQELCGAFQILFDESQTCERCVIHDCGDFTHYENFAAVTEASGNPLDADGRFPKMIDIYVKVMRFIIESALKKYRHVDVIINQGNHSRTNDIWMPRLIEAAYGHTGRVHVLNNSNVFIPYRMGNTFVMTHHSDKTKPERLPMVMANDFRQDWGETEYHYIDVGHHHHKWKMAALETGGAVVEMWNTLAPEDKYANDAGYRAKQSMTRVDRSKTYGEIGRRVLPVKEVRNKLSKALKKTDYQEPERRVVHTV